MFLGRPVNLWTGLFSGLVATLITVIGATSTPEVSQQWAIILGAVGGFLGIAVAFLAGQPPTLSPGDTFTVKTASGLPDYTTTVAHPPKADPAPVPKDEP